MTNLIREERTTVSTEYHILEDKDSRLLAELLASDQEIILPMVELIEDSCMAVDKLMEMLGKAMGKKELCRTLTSTNIIEISISGIKSRTERVKRRRDGSMVK
ncbi:MAG: hypothetical protein QMD10_09030 [Desulfitobacteriaceae bacterium]|nr:hypothetical protein [Desulfitobacteriaceae bacterium]